MKSLADIARRVTPKPASLRPFRSTIHLRGKRAFVAKPRPVKRVRA